MPEPAERREVDGEPLGDDARFDWTLRPRTFAEVVGQTAPASLQARVRERDNAANSVRRP